MIRRLLSVLHARNWNSCATAHAGVHAAAAGHAGDRMGFVFGGPERPLFRSACSPATRTGRRTRSCASATSSSSPWRNESAALRKVTHQQIDLLVDLHAPPRYW